VSGYEPERIGYWFPRHTLRLRGHQDALVVCLWLVSLAGLFLVSIPVNLVRFLVGLARAVRG
jgi:hypothetical protein